MPFAVRLEGDVTTPYFQLDASGVIKQTVAVPFGTRALSCRLAFQNMTGSSTTETTTAALISWKMIGHFRRLPAATGTLIFRSTDELSFRVRLDGQEVPV